MIQFDEHIFQMGWFNHQLVNIGGICWYIISVTLPRLPNFSKFETSFFCFMITFPSWNPQKNWKHEMNIFRILFYRLEKNMKSWRKHVFQSWFFHPLIYPEKKQRNSFCLNKKWVVFPMFFQGMKVADFFFGTLPNSIQERWRLKCHIGKLMMPSGDTKATWDSKVVGMRTFESLVGHFDISGIFGVLMVDHVVFFWPAKQLGGVVSEMKWVYIFSWWIYV